MFQLPDWHKVCWFDCVPIHFQSVCHVAHIFSHTECFIFDCISITYFSCQAGPDQHSGQLLHLVLLPAFIRYILYEYTTLNRLMTKSASANPPKPFTQSVQQKCFWGNTIKIRRFCPFLVIPPLLLFISVFSNISTSTFCFNF